MGLLEVFNSTLRSERKYAAHLIRQFGFARWPHAALAFESEFIPVRELNLAVTAHARLLLTGAAGTGKSMALASLALAHARALAAHQNHALIPIFFSGRDLHPAALPRAHNLPEALRLADFSSDFFANAIADHRALVLIDDLDALPADAAENLLQEFSAARIIATSHNAMLGLEEFPLPAWRDQDLERYAKLRFGPRAEAFRAALKASGVPRLVTRNAMSVALLAHAWQSEQPAASTLTELHTALDLKSMPTRRTELFDAYARQALDSNAETARTLEGVALAIQRGKPAPNDLVAKSGGFLREAKNHTCDFIHDLWRAYFAARAAHLAGDLSPIADHLDDPSWRELILFYAGLGDASELVAALVRRGDWLLAGSAIAHAQKVAADWHEVVTKELIEHAWNGDDRAPVVLGEMQSDSAIAAFAAQLRDAEPAVRARAAGILGRLQLDRALEYLLPQMRDVNPDTRDLVVQALGHSLSNRVIEPLLGAFRGDPRVGIVDTRLRVAAAKALGHVGSDKAVPALIVDLQMGEPEVRPVAAEALKRISSPLMIKPLKGMLPSVDEETRKYIAAVLSTVNGEMKQ